MTKHTPISPDPKPDTEAHPLPDEAIVPVAPRHDGWTPDRQRRFIEVLADSGSVSAAARAVDMTAQSAWRLRRRADARAFDAAWDAALERSLQRLLPAAIDRALNGALRSRYYHGELIAEEYVPSDRLPIWLLERGTRMLGHSDARGVMREDWEQSLDALEAGVAHAPEPPRPFTLDRTRDGRYLTNAPPPPDFSGYCTGKPGDKDYLRFTTKAEEDAMKARSRVATPAQEAARRRFFGLD